jgi:hypothetical protein
MDPSRSDCAAIPMTFDNAKNPNYATAIPRRRKVTFAATALFNSLSAYISSDCNYTTTTPIARLPYCTTYTRIRYNSTDKHVPYASRT